MSSFLLRLERQLKDSLKSTSNSSSSAGSFLIHPPAKREENDIVISGILKDGIRALSEKRTSLSFIPVKPTFAGLLKKTDFRSFLARFLKVRKLLNSGNQYNTFHSLYEDLKFGHFTSYLCRDGKEIDRKASCMYKVVVLLNKSFAFLKFSSPSPP